MSHSDIGCYCLRCKSESETLKIHTHAYTRMRASIYTLYNIEKLWNRKVTVVLVIIGVFGTVPKSLAKRLE